MRLPRIALLGCALVACPKPRNSPDASTGDAAVTAAPSTARDEVIDLTESFRQGAISSGGPVVDLGERQAQAYLVGAAELPTETVNGDSWVSVGTRLRLRVPIGEPGGPEGPDGVRLRVRRAASRGVALMVDGVLVRAAQLPQDGAPAVITLPVPRDRFARSVAEIELRFGTPRAVPGVLSPVAAQVDWVQVAHGTAAPARVADLVSDVAVERTPRRALTFHAPTQLSTVMVLPAHAMWRASLAAEGPHGARYDEPVTATLRAEADGADAIEERVELEPNARWHDAALDLSQFGGRPVRLSLAAGGPDEVRVAVAAPSLLHPPLANARAGTAAAPSVRHVVMVVARGLRRDRVLPTLSPNLRAGGFSRLATEGLVAVAQSPAPREFTALVSATTGLAADLHHVSDLTDSLDEDAPTLLGALNTLGVSTSVYTDDVAWVGSGADRGARERHTCANDAATCRPEWMFTAAADELVAHRDAPTFTMIVSRAGVMPLEPANEDVLTLDASEYDGTMTPARTSSWSALGRGHTEGVDLTEPDRARLGLLYDASLLALDRGIAQLLERMRDHNLDDDTVVIVVGDRGVALGEARAVGDGPMTLTSVSETVLLARGPGMPAGRVEGVVGVLDAAATAVERLGATAPAEFEGVALPHGERMHDRVLAFVASPRWDVGLRFADLVAIPRSPREGGGLGLFARDGDVFAPDDLAPLRPIARELAERAMASFRPGAGRRVFPPSTRVLPAPLEAVLRGHR